MWRRMAVSRASRYAASVALVVLAGCAHPVAKGPAPLDVDVVPVRLGSLVTSLHLDGQIVPLRESTLSSPQSGTLESVDVEEGGSVTQGQVLARLDASGLRAQLAANVALVAQARAKVASATEQLPIASQQYSSAATNAGQSVEQARNRIATADAALANARLVYESDRNLVAQGFVARTTVESAHAAEVSATREAANARAALSAAQAGFTSARANTGQTGVERESIEGDRAALAQAEANVAYIQSQIFQTVVRAPFDGIVTARLLDPGAFTGPNQAIVRVSQLSTVFVNASVPESDLGFVRPGLRAVVTSASLPGRSYAGAISSVNPTPANGTFSYRARMRLSNPGGALRGGMLVTLEIVRDRRRNVPVVPRAALATLSGTSGVYLVSNGHAKFVPVTLGLATDTAVQISGPGIGTGTLVIVTRPDALQDGSPVLASSTAASGA